MVYKVFKNIPRTSLIRMVNKNIQKVFKDNALDYNICIVGDRGYIVNGMGNMQSEVEISFADEGRAMSACRQRTFQRQLYECNEQRKSEALGLSVRRGIGEQPCSD